MTRLLVLLVLFFNPGAVVAQEYELALMPRVPVLQLPKSLPLAPILQPLSSPIKCLFILTASPSVAPDELYLKMWLGVPPVLR